MFRTGLDICHYERDVLEMRGLGASLGAIGESKAEDHGNGR